MAKPRIQIPTKNIAYFLISSPVIPPLEQAILDACQQQINKKTSTVYILFSTPGGQVVTGINIYNYLRALPLRIITHNMGSVDSIGTVVFLAGDQRFSAPHSTFMFHGVGHQLKGNVRLVRPELLAKLDQLDADEGKIAAIINDRATFESLDSVSELFREQSTKGNNFALRHGIIDAERAINIPRGAEIVHFNVQQKTG